MKKFITFTLAIALLASASTCLTWVMEQKKTTKKTITHGRLTDPSKKKFQKIQKERKKSKLPKDPAFIPKPKKPHPIIAPKDQRKILKKKDWFIYKK